MRHCNWILAILKQNLKFFVINKTYRINFQTSELFKFIDNILNSKHLKTANLYKKSIWFFSYQSLYYRCFNSMNFNPINANWSSNQLHSQKTIVYLHFALRITSDLIINGVKITNLCPKLKWNTNDTDDDVNFEQRNAFQHEG